MRCGPTRFAREFRISKDFVDGLLYCATRQSAPAPSATKNDGDEDDEEEEEGGEDEEAKKKEAARAREKAKRKAAATAAGFGALEDSDDDEEEEELVLEAPPVMGSTVSADCSAELAALVLIRCVRLLLEPPP